MYFYEIKDGKLLMYIDGKLIKGIRAEDIYDVPFAQWFMQHTIAIGMREAA